VIILDVYIKGNCDGRDICKLIKGNSETRHIPVILMSASIQLLKNFEQCNADAVIAKPFDLLLLLEKIKCLAHYNIGEIINENRNESHRLISLMNQNAQNESYVPQ
jgi:Response regulator containing a CheY-like receiver domain and a GGDEF domain